MAKGTAVRNIRKRTKTRKRKDRILEDKKN